MRLVYISTSQVSAFFNIVYVDTMSFLMYVLLRIDLFREVRVAERVLLNA